jgi:hypothetical protein
MFEIENPPLCAKWGARTPEPSPLAHQILHAKPYAFLDNAPS